MREVGKNALPFTCSSAVLLFIHVVKEVRDFEISAIKLSGYCSRNPKGLFVLVVTQLLRIKVELCSFELDLAIENELLGVSIPVAPVGTKLVQSFLPSQSPFGDPHEVVHLPVLGDAHLFDETLSGGLVRLDSGEVSLLHEHRDVRRKLVLDWSLVGGQWVCLQNLTSAFVHPKTCRS